MLHQKRKKSRINVRLVLAIIRHYDNAGCQATLSLTAATQRCIEQTVTSAASSAHTAKQRRVFISDWHLSKCDSCFIKTRETSKKWAKNIAYIFMDCNENQCCDVMRWICVVVLVVIHGAAGE